MCIAKHTMYTQNFTQMVKTLQYFKKSDEVLLTIFELRLWLVLIKFRRTTIVLNSCFSSLALFKYSWSSLRPISGSPLHALLHFHSCPIYLVVFKGSYCLTAGISHLGGGFTLRCLQRLSLPDLATLPCTWRCNRYTSGPSTPVLSY